MNSDAIPSHIDPVDELAEQYLRRRRRGEHPTPAEYAARYSEHAARILELFPALELIEGLKPTPDDHIDFSGDAAGCEANSVPEVIEKSVLQARQRKRGAPFGCRQS